MTEDYPKYLPATGWRKLEGHETIQRGDIFVGHAGAHCVMRANDIGDRADHAVQLHYYRKEEPKMQDIPQTFPAPGWRKLADGEVIVKGDVAFYRDGHTKRSANMGKTVAASTQAAVKEYYRKEEAMLSNAQKIQQLKDLIEELAACGTEALEEAQRIARDATPPKPAVPLWRDGTEIKVGDWFVWNTAVEGAPPDYGPVTSVEDGRIRIGYWVFRNEIKKLERIAPRPEIKGYKVLEPRDVKPGNTYLGIDGIVHTSTVDKTVRSPRWILEKIQSKCLASDGEELKVGDWVSWDVEVACAEPDYGPVVLAEDGEVRVKRQRCGYTGYFGGSYVQKLNRIPAKPDPIPGYKILEPGYAKRGQWWANRSRNAVQATADYDKHPSNLRWILEPVPQYRPFMGGAEAVARLQDPLIRDGVKYRWAVWSNSFAVLFRGFDNIEAETTDILAWETLFRTCTFADGTPVGVKI